MGELEANYTIVIGTHNMQQATRVSDYTGFFNLDGVGQPGHLVEFGETSRSSTTRETRRPNGT